MKYNIRYKAHDAYIKTTTLSQADQDLLKSKGISSPYVSYDKVRNISEIVEEIKHGKTPFTRSDMMKRFGQESEPVFKYLSALNNKQLYTAINRTEENVQPQFANLKYLLGLRRFSFHHTARPDSDADYIVRVEPSETYTYFFYSNLDKLVADIKRVVSEKY